MEQVKNSLLERMKREIDEFKKVQETEGVEAATKLLNEKLAKSFKPRQPKRGENVLFPQISEADMKLYAKNLKNKTQKGE